MCSQYLANLTAPTVNNSGTVLFSTYARVGTGYRAALASTVVPVSSSDTADVVITELPRSSFTTSYILSNAGRWVSGDMYTTGSSVPLGCEGRFAAAFDIRDDGNSVVGGCDQSYGYRAMAWSRSGPEWVPQYLHSTLETYLGHYSQSTINNVNIRGEMVGRMYDSSYGGLAFIAGTSTGTIPLDYLAPGLGLFQPIGINSSGVVLAEGVGFHIICPASTPGPCGVAKLSSVP